MDGNLNKSIQKIKKYIAKQPNEKIRESEEIIIDTIYKEGIEEGAKVIKIQGICEIDVPVDNRENFCSSLLESIHIVFNKGSVKKENKKIDNPSEECKVYTSREIAEEMCLNALLYYIEEKTDISYIELRTWYEQDRNSIPDETKQKILYVVSRAKIVDLSCGTGNLLIAMFSVLNRFIERLIIENEEKNKYLLKIIRNIYGMDIDKLGIKICIYRIIIEKCRNLRSRIREIEKILYKNIIFGDITRENTRKIKSYDIHIGNPPYIGYKKINEEAKKYLTQKYNKYSSNKDVTWQPSKILYSQWNLYVIFILEMWEKCNKDGVISILIPRNFINVNFCETIRRLIFERMRIYHIHLVDNPYVDEVNIGAIILYLTPNFETQYKYLLEENKVKEERYIDFKIRRMNGNEVWSLLTLNNEQYNICTKLMTNSIELGHLCKFMCEIDSAGTEQEVAQESFVAIITQNIHDTKIKNEKIIYISKEKCTHKKICKKEFINKNQSNHFENIVRILIRSTCRYDNKKIVSFLDNKQIYRGVQHVINICNRDEELLWYIWGLLNSKLILYYYCQVYQGLMMTGEYYNVKSWAIKNLPVKDYDANNTVIREIIEVSKKVNKEEIDNKLLNEKVYELYGISDTDIVSINKFLKENNN